MYIAAIAEKPLYVAGDVVECIDNEGNTTASQSVTVGKTYTVAEVYLESGRHYFVKLVEVPNTSLYAFRFKLHIVKCTCDTNQLMWGGCICGAIESERNRNKI